jgi:HEAT repeat protein
MDLKVLQDIPPWEWPENAGAMLREMLLDDRTPEADRVLAAELAADYTVISDELADALLANLGRGSRPDEVRSRAAISLGPVLEQGYVEGFEDADAVPITERTFHRIQESLRMLYEDANVAKEVRRSSLEASVRAPVDWHRDAVRAAYSSNDEDWRLTAAFCMRFVRGFDEQILEALHSENRDIRYQAVVAAGNWELDEAWPHVAALLNSKRTEKSLLLAAIEAAASIRPGEAAEILIDLTNSRDEDIVEAAYEAMAMAEDPWTEDEEYEDDDDDDDDDDDERTP